jgi:hypothetical protein
MCSSPVALELGTYIYLEIVELRRATTADVRRCTPLGRRFKLRDLAAQRPPEFTKVVLPQP